MYSSVCVERKEVVSHQLVVGALLKIGALDRGQIVSKCEHTTQNLLQRLNVGCRFVPSRYSSIPILLGPNHLNSSVPTVVDGSSGVKRKWLRGLTTVTSYFSLSTSRAAPTASSTRSNRLGWVDIVMPDSVTSVEQKVFLRDKCFQEETATSTTYHTTSSLFGHGTPIVTGFRSERFLVSRQQQ